MGDAGIHSLRILQAIGVGVRLVLMDMVGLAAPQILLLAVLVAKTANVPHSTNQISCHQSSRICQQPLRLKQEDAGIHSLRILQAIGVGVRLVLMDMVTIAAPQISLSAVLVAKTANVPHSTNPISCPSSWSE